MNSNDDRNHHHNLIEERERRTKSEHRFYTEKISHSPTLQFCSMFSVLTNEILESSSELQDIARKQGKGMLLLPPPLQLGNQLDQATRADLDEQELYMEPQGSYAESEDSLAFLNDCSEAGKPLYGGYLLFSASCQDDGGGSHSTAPTNPGKPQKQGYPELDQ
ncbi:hypothetical protein JTB14_010870 [Gonioctena quinquepunctata]|nr:hypothetical protein JTB14_010870 [Gonioctena quinquepunctata]